MARIRSIHPGLWTDEDFVSMSMEARILYIGIWSESDDQGAFAWKPRTLKARILPGDNVDAVALLQEMIDVGLVRQSEDEGSPIGLLKNFCKWQRPKKPSLFFTIPEEMRSFVGLKDEDSDTNNRRKAIWARFEGRCFYCGTEVTYYNKKHNSLEIDHVVPVSKGGSDDESNLACSCRNCNRSKNDLSANDFFAFRKLKKLPVSDGFARLVGEIRSPEKLVSECENENSHCENGFRTAEGRKGGREEGNISPSLRSGSSSSPSAEAGRSRAAEFDEFWAAYPRKVDKGSAMKAHTKARTRTPQAEIMLGLSRHVAVWPDRKSALGFDLIPYPASWLNAMGWAGDPEASAAARKHASPHHIPQRPQGRPAIWDAIPDCPGV